MSDTEAKTRPASPRKLRRLRSEGSVPAGQEVAGYAAAAVGLGAAGFLIASLPERISALIDAAFNLNDVPREAALSGVRDTLIAELGTLIGPIAGLALGASVVILLVWNKGIVFAIKPVVPDISRVSPSAGLKRVFGRRGWTETGMGLVKVIIWVAATAAIGAAYLPFLLKNPACNAACQWQVVSPIPWALNMTAIAILLACAGIEMLIQRNLFLHEQRMTESEVKQERKEQSGDPAIRKERRRRQRDTGPTSDVVGADKANMCFYAGARAVALRYHPEKTPVPRLSSKADGAQPVSDLRANVRKRGFPERQSDEIVAACFTLAPGEMVPEDIFKPLVAAMNEMFGN